MPTIASLPPATAVSPTDFLAIDQGTGTNSVSVAILQQGLQPAILTPTGSLLGRVSTGTGSPETVSVGAGLVMSAGTLAVGGSIDGLLAGETVDQLQAAAPAADSDSFAVDQGGAALVKQSLAGLWSYIANKIPLTQRRVVEITSNTVLDATAHNNAILICSQSVVLTANFVNMGSGFSCDVLNLSSGTVTMGQGITVGSGNAGLPQKLSARLTAFTYSGGSLVFWDGQSGTATSGSGTTTGTTSGGGTTGGSSGGGTTTTPSVSLVFVTAPSGSYSLSQTNVGVNATLSGAGTTVTVAFGVSSSTSAAPATWTAGTLVNTQANGSSFWGAYLTMPATAGTYYCWAKSSDGSAQAVSAGFTVA
ncbi:hypothetical protein [Acidisoma sp. C75]